MGTPIPYPTPPIVGAQFVMRPFRMDDFDAAVELEQDTEACRLDGGLLHLVIADRVTDAYLGEIMLALGEHRVGELGCCLVPAARGRGIATEALVTLTDWAFAQLGLGRLQVFVAPENVAA